MLENRTLKNFADETASSSPTPGGGSVAAYIASLATSLCLMSINITKNRKSFKKLDLDQQIKIEECSKFITILQNKINGLLEKDIATFNQYMEVYKDKGAIDYNERLEKATIDCFLVPHQLSICCMGIFYEMSKVEDFIVNSVISDLIEGAILLKACVESCVVNMNINLRNIKSNEILELAKNVKDNKIQDFYKDVTIFVTRNNQKI